MVWLASLVHRGLWFTTSLPVKVLRTLCWKEGPQDLKCRASAWRNDLEPRAVTQSQHHWCR